MRVRGPFACMVNAIYYGAGVAVDVLGNCLWRPVYRACCTRKICANGKGEPKGGCIQCLHICPMVCHVLVTALAYVQIVVTMFATNVYYLMLVTASVYTDAVVKRFKLIERSNESSPAETSHEKVAQITARLHGLFWLFVPGAALLAKMCEYLNENLAIFIFDDLTNDVTEVSTRDSLPKLESTEVKADKLNEKDNQIITIEDKESASTKHIQCKKIVADGKKYTVRQVLESESSGESTSRVLTVEATLDPPGKANANESLSDEGKPSRFELVVTGSGITVRNTGLFYRECRTGEPFLGIDRGILASNTSWGLGLVKFIFFFLAWVALTHDQSYFAARTVLGFLSLPIALISTIKRSIGACLRAGRARRDASATLSAACRLTYCHA
jgi:hypothetical protein